jgi:hypothetical protein
MLQHYWRTNLILINQAIKPYQVKSSQLSCTRPHQGRHPSPHFGVLTTLSLAPGRRS